MSTLTVYMTLFHRFTLKVFEGKEKCKVYACETSGLTESKKRRSMVALKNLWGFTDWTTWGNLLCTPFLELFPSGWHFCVVHLRIDVYTHGFCCMLYVNPCSASRCTFEWKFIPLTILQRVARNKKLCASLLLAVGFSFFGNEDIRIFITTSISWQKNLFKNNKYRKFVSNFVFSMIGYAYKCRRAFVNEFYTAWVIFWKLKVN